MNENEPQPLTVVSWPRAILHVDGDAFFASCEQAVHPELRGRPVITGRERGIVAAASYEAKQRGIKRGMRLFEVKRVCPEAVLLPSDYETYSLFSLRMYAILRRFTPDVEEYSIDEAFADLTGLRRVYHGNYGEIGAKVQETIIRELGISVSVGVAPTKVLAKVASKWKKPRGLTVIPGREIHRYLAELPVGSIWGIGPNTAALLDKLGVLNALMFARRDEAFVRRHFPRPVTAVWHELNGNSVFPIVTEEKTGYQSICKSRTFTPAKTDPVFLFAQLARNLEDACIKARNHHLAAERLVAWIRTQEFREAAVELHLNRDSAYPQELTGPLRQAFTSLYRPNTPYRSTGVVLIGLRPTKDIQRSLFEDPLRVEKLSKVYQAVDALAERFGKHTVHLGASLPVKQQAQHEGERGDIPERQRDLFRGENGKQRLGLPVLKLSV